MPTSICVHQPDRTFLLKRRFRRKWKQAVRRHPQVAAVDRFRNFTLPYREGLVTLGAGDFTVSDGARQAADQRTFWQCGSPSRSDWPGCCRCFREFFSEAFRSTWRSRNSHDARRGERLSRCRGLLRLFERSRGHRHGPDNACQILWAHGAYEPDDLFAAGRLGR